MKEFDYGKTGVLTLNAQQLMVSIMKDFDFPDDTPVLIESVEWNPSRREVKVYVRGHGEQLGEVTPFLSGRNEMLGWLCPSKNSSSCPAAGRNLWAGFQQLPAGEEKE